MRSSKIVFPVLFTAFVLGSAVASADDIAWDKVVGANPGKLNAEQKQRVKDNLNRLKNTRGCTGTIAVCMAKGDQTARRHAGFVVRMVRKKKQDDFIKRGIAKRVESAFPQETFSPNLSGHPSMGGKAAKVVIVEYACFQCPFCAYLAPKLKKLDKKFGGKVVHYYKFFPVRSHSKGVASALAGVASMKQGKFWQMYSLMYANRSDLDDDDILNYAQQVGMDIAKFKADMKDPKVMKFIEKDKLEGMRYGVDGTPTFFINGKVFVGLNDYAEILDRLGEEIDIVEGKIK